MNEEQKLALIEALRFYIPAATPYKPDVHIELLIQVLAQLETEVPPAPAEQDLFE